MRKKAVPDSRKEIKINVFKMMKKKERAKKSLPKKLSKLLKEYSFVVSYDDEGEIKYLSQGRKSTLMGLISFAELVQRKTAFEALEIERHEMEIRARLHERNLD